MSKNNQIILASGSPRRKVLLKQINLDFIVQVSNASETYDSNDAPDVIVRDLALRKAEQVAEEHIDEEPLVIGADTIVVFKQKILEKPSSPSEAQSMLRILSGNTHQVLTGVALVKNYSTGNKKNVLTFVESTDVTFGYLEDHEIEEYVQSGSPLDKAGAYGIQDDWGAIFVKKINGDYYNVVGFPLHSFYQHVKEFAPEFIPHCSRHPVE